MMDNTMSQIIFAFVIAVMAALVGAIAQPVWEKVIRRKSILHARIRVNRMKIPHYISEGIEEYNRLQYSNGKFPKPKPDTVTKLREFSNTKCFIELELLNRSNSEISGVRISLHEMKAAIFEIQTPDDHKTTEFAHAIEIGSLLPNSKTIIHIWTWWDYSAQISASYSNIVDITAKQYDRVIFNPKHHYITDRNFFLFNKHKTISIFYILIFISIMIFFIIINIIKY